MNTGKCVDLEGKSLTENKEDGWGLLNPCSEILY